jgi:hypothetical protein
MASRHGGTDFGGPCLDSTCRALLMLFVGSMAILNVTTSLLTAQHIIAPTLYLGYRAVSPGLYLVGVTTTRAILAEWLWHSAGNAPEHPSRYILSTPLGFLANCLLIAAAPFVRLLHIITCPTCHPPSRCPGMWTRARYSGKNSRQRARWSRSHRTKSRKIEANRAKSLEKWTLAARRSSYCVI